MYELYGDERAQRYFMINSDNGEVSVKTSLLDDDQERYNVSYIVKTLCVYSTKITLTSPSFYPVPPFPLNVKGQPLKFMTGK